MALGCGANCVRYLVFIVNLIFFLGGVAIAIVGGVILGTDFASHSRATLDDSINFDTLGIVLIVIGVVVLVIPFQGCCGAVRKSDCILIKMLLIILVGDLILVVVTAQLVIGALAIRSHNKTELRERGFASLAKTNSSDRTFWAAWNYTQKHLKCCGVKGPRDWTSTKGTPYYRHEDPEPLYPDQCCETYEENCALKGESRYYEEGCIKKIISEFKESSLIIGRVTLVIALLELIGDVFLCCVPVCLPNPDSFYTWALQLPPRDDGNDSGEWDE